jgi:hypothetical protein
MSKEGACEYKESWNLSTKPVPGCNVPHRTDLLTSRFMGHCPFAMISSEQQADRRKIDHS